MKLFLSAYFLPIFANRVLGGVVRGLNRVFCMLISIHAYNIFSVAALSSVADSVVNIVLVNNGCM